MTPVASPSATQQLQLLVFRVRGEECAVALTDAREIIIAGELTPVPAAPTSIRGMVNIRGRVVTVVDLAVILGLSGEGVGQHIIVAERGSDVFGVLVDGVTGVLRVDADQLQHAPDLVQAKPAARYVKGVVVLAATKKKPAADESASDHPATPATSQASVHAEAESRLIVLLDLPGLLDEVGHPVVSPTQI